MLKCTDQVNSLLNDMDRQSVPFAKCKVSLYAGDLKNLDLMYPLKFFVLFFFTTEVLFPPLFPVRTRFIFLFFIGGLFFFFGGVILGKMPFQYVLLQFKEAFYLFVSLLNRFSSLRLLKKLLFSIPIATVNGKLIGEIFLNKNIIAKDSAKRFRNVLSNVTFVHFFV